MSCGVKARRRPRAPGGPSSTWDLKVSQETCAENALLVEVTDRVKDQITKRLFLYVLISYGLWFLLMISGFLLFLDSSDDFFKTTSRTILF